LILFRFPRDGDDAGKLVAELISEPPGRKRPAGVPKGQDHHEAEIQVATGGPELVLGRGQNQMRSLAKVEAPRTHALAPFPLPARRKNAAHAPRVEITIPGRKPVGVRRSRSFYEHVPRIAQLADMTTPPLALGQEDDSYVRTTVVVNRGTLRVTDVVTWDTSYQLGATALHTPSGPAVVKFMGINFGGHAATECVLEVHDTDAVEIHWPEREDFARSFQSTRARNQLAPERTTEVMVRNYEYQRTSPVPWGLDFQWLFARLGYDTVDLGDELRTFRRMAQGNQTLQPLLRSDLTSHIRGVKGWPFPYIVSHASLTPLFPLLPHSPLTAIKNRPLCIPGT
jgi:hypothetical protein